MRSHAQLVSGWSQSDSISELVSSSFIDLCTLARRGAIRRDSCYTVSAVKRERSSRPSNSALSLPKNLKTGPLDLMTFKDGSTNEETSAKESARVTNACCSNSMIITRFFFADERKKGTRVAMDLDRIRTSIDQTYRLVGDRETACVLGSNIVLGLRMLGQFPPADYGEDLSLIEVRSTSKL